MHSTGRRLVRWLGVGLMWLALNPAGAAATGDLAPNFALKSLSGSNLRLSEQRGRVVLVNFWASWCGPCRQEMPKLDALAAKYRATGLVLLGVNVDDDARAGRAMAQKLGVRFPVLFDSDKRVVRLYDVKVMPSTVLIGRDGRVRHVHLGYKPGYEQTYETQIRELLKE